MTAIKPLKYAKNPFIFHDGTVVSTVSELKDKIKVIDESSLRSFVNQEKNDFANWVLYSLNNPELALELKDALDKDSIISVLENYENNHEEQSSDDVKEYSEKESKLKISSDKNKKSFKEKFEEEILKKRKKDGIADYETKTTSSSKSSKKDSADDSEEATSSTKSKESSDKGNSNDDAKSLNIVKEEKINVDDYKMKESVLKNNDDMITEEEAKRYAEIFSRMREEIHKVYIGQDDVLQRIQITLLSDAHALLEGVPGLAKSLLVEVLANIISDTTFKRIQFLPDMLPSDVIGGQIYNPRTASFVTVKGPIFANFVLADEINRAPPKTHAALMEAMQEKKINIDKEEYDLDRPFLVLATQNPLENKGTYALPEAVLDRFMFKINLDYPSREHEKIIITENATTRSIIQVRKVNHIISKQDFLMIQKKVKNVHISDKIKDYILDLIEATRGLNKDIEGRQFIKYGGGPRASIYLGIASKARAVLMGRNYVLPEDIVFVAHDVLRHRIALNFKGKAHNISSDKIIDEILSKVSAL